MKKRKELDALLLNNMNGKKISKSCNGKEGHELLRNEASWDSNSTENEDFFSPPRKLMIRTPHRWRFCATCVQLGVFVVMVACIVVTGGLIWMHLDLKQDLDELRLRIAKVESSLETSTEQASTVSTLLSKIEQLQNLPAQISSINRQIGALNLSIQLQVKIKADSRIRTLEQTTAQFGSTMQGIQGLQAHHSEQVDTLTSSIASLQSSLSDLQGEVTKMLPTTPPPSESTSRPTPIPANPTADTKSPTMSTDGVIQSLQQGFDGLSSAVGQLNDSMVSVELWKQDLMLRIVALESASSRGTLDLNLAEKVNQLQTQVNALMGSLHNQTVESGVQAPIHTASNEQSAWHQDVESRLQTIQNKLTELDLSDLRANLQRLNTTQRQIQDAFESFKKENLKAITDLQHEDTGHWGRLLQQHNDILDLHEEVASILGVTEPPVEQSPDDISNADKSVTTEASATTDNLQSITIEGISGLKELEIEFFKWDKNFDDWVSYDELKDFLGPDAPTKDVLMHYDKDGNGKWSLAEMETALGIQG
ncbi:EF-hand calcium-binding domain-containing protein 14-like [Asterias rubens]|uniref:EF-hand calcium-binding domain-containing protein 14-like n=1 Tax=Asterias rubens TaxID=7604 RepID=UPI001455B650|nr:EF-hand calcium-binding domain-containing protein 14-like [Asterias rubens]